jgi:hypothetical protein
MAGITLEQAESKLAEYLAAESAVLSGQRYKIDGREMQKADLVAIQAGLEYWNTWVIRLSSGRKGPRIRLGVPR